MQLIHGLEIIGGGEMKEVNQIIHSQIDCESKQVKHSQNSKRWSSETEKLVILLFTRLADIFQNKCKTQGIEIYKDDSCEKHSQTFKLWCLKIHDAGLSAEDIAKGIKHLEESVRDSVRAENDIWPPSYPEFIGHCQKQAEREMYKTWFGLPKTKLKPEENKKRMMEMRKKLKL